MKKVYEGSIVSSNGVLFKTDSDSTKLTALVKDDGVDITSKYSIVWYKDDVQLSTSQTITVSASDLSEKAVYRFKAMSGEILKASAEVTVLRLQDGQNGTSAYVHIAYANSSDGRVDFSLTDSNRKFIGQYSDSKQYGSDDPTQYRWSAIKGEDGQSFVSAEEQFYYSTSQTELIGGEWFVGNVVYQPDKFLWKRWKCTYANPSEIKYTKAIFDNTWNEIDAKIGEIHTQVSQANTQSKEALGKAAQAQTAASKANELANTANTQSSEAKQLAQDANTSTGNAQKQIDAIKGDITDSKQQIQDAVDKANANANEINTVKETYATKVDLTNESKSIHADVSTEIEKKVGELSTTVSETYASKSDLTSIEGSLNTKIKQNADSITTQASSIEKLQSDTTQAQLDITEATKKASDAQTQASTALSNAQSAQTLADQAKQKADSAQTNLDSANQELADAKANLKSVTGRVDATEGEITKAQTRLTDAETAVQKAQTDATKAQGNATTAISNAKTAQGVADDAKAKAEKAQKELAELTNKVSSNTTKIEQNAKAITLQANSITETSNKIDNLQIGGKNLILESDTKRTNSYYLTGRYYLSENLRKGEKYTIQLWGDLGEKKESFGLWLQQGVIGVGIVLKKGNNYGTLTFTCPNVASLTVLNSIEIYALEPSVTASSTITKIKLELGNKATDWTPAPEDLENDLHNNYYSKTQTDAQIKVSADKITQSVTEVNKVATSANSKIDNLQIGGRNLAKWTSDGANWQKTSFDKDTRTFAIENTATTERFIGLYNKTGLSPGNTYVLSAYIWSNGNVSSCDMVVYNSQISVVKVNSINKTQLTSNPQKFHLTFTIPSSSTGWDAATIRFDNNGTISEGTTAILYVKDIKLELGNKATDWTPAPEDLEQHTDDKIAVSEKTTEEAYKALLDQTAKDINILVQKVQKETSANSTSIADMTTNFKVTADGLSATKLAIKTLTNAVNGTVSQEEMKKYIRWDGDDLELGNSVQPFKCKLSNTELAFYQNSDKVAWISNKELNILKAIIAQSIGCGNFMFIDEGDLGFSLI